MKQVLQNLGSGETLLVEVPCPRRKEGEVLIESTRSLVSLGTEKMLLDFGKGSLLAKARQQPDKVKQVLQKVKTDGLAMTLDAVKAKLDQPIALGYCNVGTVVDAEEGSSFKVGQRVVSNGSHAEMVSVGEHLCAEVPEGVSDDEAAFTVVGAIGLQGVRLLAPTLGERVVVCGLGLIGLLTVQMLRAQGCQVLGVDFDEEKLKLAYSFGAEVVNLSKGEDPLEVADLWSGGVGVDGVLITASAKSDEVVHQAATMCRKRGRIVLVGVVGLNLRRDDFYKKELSFQVSCSYGPGRYDEDYERGAVDYPIGFVRWTEQRNFEAVLQLMADGSLDVGGLISHQFGFDSALEAYEVVGSGQALGILLEYLTGKKARLRKRMSSVVVNESEEQKDELVLGFIGAGNFTTRMLLPALKWEKVRLKTIVSSVGVTGTHAARKFGFEKSTSDVEEVFKDDKINAVFITTPHNSHADFSCRALKSGKAVFVEKPLALNLQGLEGIEKLIKGGSSPLLMVGFNRRFSPHVQWLRKQLEQARRPKAVVITVNAGAVPEDHWTQDREIGGGRIIGEGCHFIDLARYLVGKPIVEERVQYLGGASGRLRDCASLHFKFEDGSIATVHYLSNGHKNFPKERVEVFVAGKVLQIDNFRKSSGEGIRGGFKTRKQDKGHVAGVKAFLEGIKSGKWPIPSKELLEVSRTAVRLGKTVD